MTRHPLPVHNSLARTLTSATARVQNSEAEEPFVLLVLCLTMFAALGAAVFAPALGWFVTLLSGAIVLTEIVWARTRFVTIVSVRRGALAAAEDALARIEASGRLVAGAGVLDGAFVEALTDARALHAQVLADAALEYRSRKAAIAAVGDDAGFHALSYAAGTSNAGPSSVPVAARSLFASLHDVAQAAVVRIDADVVALTNLASSVEAAQLAITGVEKARVLGSNLSLARESARTAVLARENQLAALAADSTQIRRELEAQFPLS